MLKLLKVFAKISSRFRWVACQIDIIERYYRDEARVMKTLENLPDTLFDMYAKILDCIEPEGRAFARTALALICSNNSNIKSADVLVRASLHNVPLGTIHNYGVGMLKEIFGCLIKISDLRRKPPSTYGREDTDVLQKVTVSHYTVREFLFASSKEDGKPRPAGDFALSDIDTRMLEMQVVFNGLQQWTTVRKCPTRYEEYCIETSERALRGDRRNLLVKNQSVWESVASCLLPNCPHLGSLTNGNLRKHFQNWTKLTAFVEFSREEYPEGMTYRQPMRQTQILACSILLKWPEFAQKYLQDDRFKKLTAKAKQTIWTDVFTIDPSVEVDHRGTNTSKNVSKIPKTFVRGTPMTLLRLVVSWKRVDFLELFINAGANFAHEPDIIFTALQNPYGVEDNGDGTTTGQLLKLLLERGADPNPPGFTCTPLQVAVYYLEEAWVQSLLLEGREANVVGDPNGRIPNDEEHQEWHTQHPLQICKEANVIWDPSMEGQKRKARKQVKLLLEQYGAVLPRVQRSTSLNSGGPTQVPPVVIQIHDEQ